MDSKCINILNKINSFNISKKINKINKKINKLELETETLDLLFLNQIGIVISNDDIIFREDEIKEILGFNIFNISCFYVPTYKDIKNKVQELIDNNRKYIIVTDSQAISEIIDLIFEYKDILFTSIDSTDTNYSNISNLKKMLPDNNNLSKICLNNINIDFNNFNKKLKIIGIYDSSINYQNNLKEQYDKNNIYEFNIIWFDVINFNINEWNNTISNIDYYFNFIYIIRDINFLNDKLNIYYIKYFIKKMILF